LSQRFILSSPMDTGYRHNHYVPEWYQKNFIPASKTNGKLFYLKLKPDEHRDSKGKIHVANPLKELSPRQCFAEVDLYTTRFGESESREIERLFFGAIDANGKTAVDHFADYHYPDWRPEPLHHLVEFMSTQKLRTLKGLDWLTEQLNSNNANTTLAKMLELKDLFSATWIECVWQICDADNSNTKFIVSDHPITIYNRTLGPRQPTWCRGSKDPDIRFVGSHTIYPLTLNKVLILTNLAWARNPYQKAKNYRPNPGFFRSTMFGFHNLHINRHLSEQEVREINFIIKSRAYKYVAAGNKEWLYPEKFVSKSDWNTYGDGILLMPDPRSMSYGGEVFAGYKEGSHFAVDPYGRKPGDPKFGKDDLPDNLETSPLYRFKGEFARRFGPNRRGVTLNTGQLEDEIDTDTMHKYHLKLAKKRYS